MNPVEPYRLVEPVTMSDTELAVFGRRKQRSLLYETLRFAAMCVLAAPLIYIFAVALMLVIG
jgi:hypothetical protein